MKKSQLEKQTLPPGGQSAWEQNRTPVQKNDMNKPFPTYHNDFLLYNAAGKRLFHEIASTLPVIDPHNHIDPAALASNKRFESIYGLWVQSDPYKHRAMRICGIAEEYITGDRPDYEKFLAWATCCIHTAGSPLFHWCAMELKEVFGIDEPLTPGNAKQIWETSNRKLAQEGLGALDIVKGLGVEMLCTSDDLLDTLEHHQALASQGDIRCLPSLRSDSIIAFDQPGFFFLVRKVASASRLRGKRSRYL